MHCARWNIVLFSYNLTVACHTVCVQPTVDYIGFTRTVGVVWVCRRFEYNHFCRRFGVAVLTCRRFDNRPLSLHCSLFSVNTATESGWFVLAREFKGSQLTRTPKAKFLDGGPDPATAPLCIRPQHQWYSMGEMSDDKSAIGVCVKCHVIHRKQKRNGDAAGHQHQQLPLRRAMTE